MDVPLPPVPEFVQGPQRRRAVPATIRSRVMPEVASELLAARHQPSRQVRVQMREQSAAHDWDFTLLDQAPAAAAKMIWPISGRRLEPATIQPTFDLLARSNAIAKSFPASEIFQR